MTSNSVKIFLIVVSFPSVCKPISVILLDFTGTFCLSVLPLRAFGKHQQKETAHALLSFSFSIQISGKSTKSVPVSFTLLQLDKAWSHREGKTEKNRSELMHAFLKVRILFRMTYKGCVGYICNLNSFPAGWTPCLKYNHLV